MQLISCIDTLHATTVYTLEATPPIILHDHEAEETDMEQQQTEGDNDLLETVNNKANNHRGRGTQLVACFKHSRSCYESVLDAGSRCLAEILLW